MSFFVLFDEDKLLQHLLPRIYVALVAWQRGMNADEGSLMNQITSSLNSRRARRCDIGLSGSFSLETQFCELHRQGPNQTDLYGSDLAVTVTAPASPTFVKTALLQFKVGERNRVKLEQRQIKDATINKAILDRSFCLAVDQKNKTIRVAPLSSLTSAFSPGNATATLTTELWTRFSEWVLAWLRCSVGPISQPSAADSIEKLLENYTIKEPELLAREWDLPPNF
jgi:hypothetical protein